MERQYCVRSGSSLIPVSKSERSWEGVEMEGGVSDVIVEIDSEAKNEAATKPTGAVLCET